MLPILVLALGGLIVLGMTLFAFAGPSPVKAGNRRLTELRERHSTSLTAAAEAQMRRITATRDTKMDLAFGRILPNRELLAKRLAMTGKSWTVGQYGLASAGIVVVADSDDDADSN